MSVPENKVPVWKAECRYEEQSTGIGERSAGATKWFGSPLVESRFPLEMHRNETNDIVNKKHYVGTIGYDRVEAPTNRMGSFTKA